MRTQIVFHVRARHVEHGAQEIALHRRDAGEPPQAAAAGEVQKHRLELIVGGVRRGDPAAALLLCRAAEKGIARVPERRLVAPVALIGFDETRNGMFRAICADEVRVAQRLLPALPVIKMGAEHCKAALRRKREQLREQAHGIRPAGDGAEHALAAADGINIHLRRAAFRWRRRRYTPAST